MKKHKHQLGGRVIVAFILVSMSVILLSSCAQDVLEEDADARAEIYDAHDEHLGTVLFTAEGEQMIVQATLTGLSPGWHGFHIHQHGVCVAEDEKDSAPFQSAGGHFNPDGTDHAYHKGDLPALYANADGRAVLKVVLDQFNLVDLLAGEGRAVIVHAERDNFGHIPERYQSTESDQPGPDEQTLSTGDAGARIGCGVIKGTHEDHDLS